MFENTNFFENDVSHIQDVPLTHLGNFLNYMRKEKNRIKNKYLKQRDERNRVKNKYLKLKDKKSKETKPKKKSYKKDKNLQSSKHTKRLLKKFN